MNKCKRCGAQMEGQEFFYCLACVKEDHEFELEKAAEYEAMKDLDMEV